MTDDRSDPLAPMLSYDEIYGEADPGELEVDETRPQPDPSNDSRTSSRGPSVATQLVEMARRGYEFFTDDKGECHAISILDSRAIPLRFRGKRSLRSELSTEFYRETGRAAPQEALTDALAALEGLSHEAVPRRLDLRVAEHQRRLYLDLGRPDGAAIVIDENGWDIATDHPILWRRTELSGELQLPMRGGSVELLGQLINVSPTGLHLLVGWMIASLWPSIPHPILGFSGEQGTGKTAAARTVVTLVDPGPAPLRTCPRDVETWVLSAAGSWIVALDNISSVSPWLSDALCRAVTGDGLIKRSLYTDGDLSVTAFQRVVILTSIDPGALQGDLAERCLMLELDRIPEGRRMTDAELDVALKQDGPLALGALLDLAAQVLKILPGHRPAELPRMADFARILSAVDEVTGWSTLQDYRTAGSTLLRDAGSRGSRRRSDPGIHGSDTFMVRNLPGATSPASPTRDREALAQDRSCFKRLDEAARAIASGCRGRG